MKQIVASALLLLSTAAVLNAQSAGQQVAVMKMLLPGTTAIGVLSGSMTDKKVEDLTKAGTAQGVKVIVARPKEPREVGALYKKLISQEGVRLILVPDSEDPLVLGIAFDYLREQAVQDKIGICVLDEDLVAKGALCAVQLKDGKVQVSVNQKMAVLIGATIPPEGTSSVSFVAR